VHDPLPAAARGVSAPAAGRGGQVRLLVEINPGILDGFTLTPDVARELSELGIAVDFEFAAS
jgi:hypothetical protein